MKVLITAGGTQEPIDDIRIITNINSGKLEAIIADEFIGKTDFGEKPKHDVWFLHSKTSARPIRFISCHNVEKNSVQEVYYAMKELVPQMDMVIHAMSINDFFFETENPVKLKGNNIDLFSEHIRVNGRVSPKIISYIKKWNPSVSLVGFKFTLDKTVEEIVKIAKNSAISNDCDFVIVNNNIKMKKSMEHVAFFVKQDGSYEPFHGKKQIAKGLLQSAESVLL